jgi:hypothetical protein
VRRDFSWSRRAAARFKGPAGFFSSSFMSPQLCRRNPPAAVNKNQCLTMRRQLKSMLRHEQLQEFAASGHRCTRKSQRANGRRAILKLGLVRRRRLGLGRRTGPKLTDVLEVDATYRRGDALEKRGKLMDVWAAYCEQKAGRR